VNNAARVLSNTLLALLLFSLAAETADARKRRPHYADDNDHMVVTPDRRTFESAGPRDGRRPPPIPLAAVVPPGWQLQPVEPNWTGKRFASPDGAAWLAIYKAPADIAVADHMKSVAFAGDGETLTFIQGERDGIAVAGHKGSRMFYRKAILACGGRVWHHIAFEYPAEIKDRMERFIALGAEGLHGSETDCDDTVAEQQQ
jgi:hypothetical protein